jgi:hypothetical protein
VVSGGVYVVQGDFSVGSMPLECGWSQALLALPGACVPAAGFGASDCCSGCPAHLVHFVETGNIVAQLRAVTDEKIVLWRNVLNV